METRKVGLPTLIGLVLAAIGMLVPILWDRYKSASALELQHLASASLIAQSAEFDKLQVFYASKPIDRVTRLSFALVNTGRRPIRSADIVTPPTVNLGSADILDVRVDRHDPPELSLTATPNLESHSVVVQFPLLNPGDIGRFSVLVSGPPPSFSADARIVGIQQLALRSLDRGGPRAPAEPLPWTFYVVAALTILLIAFTVAFLPEVGKEFTIRDLTRTGVIPLPSSRKKLDYEQFVDRVIRTTKTPEELAPITKVLASISTDRLLSEDEHRAFGEALLQTVNDTKSVIKVIVAFSGLVSIGISFLAYSLLTR